MHQLHIGGNAATTSNAEKQPRIVRAATARRRVDSVGRNHHPEGARMKKTQITLEDGRYLIYYTFEDETDDATPDEARED
jgi:hypothetical protein